ncbi:MAG TPA: caspase family protein [Polyangia bacterium]|nr:caspase family protein [Polyangia bacterium]
MIGPLALVLLAAQLGAAPAGARVAIVASARAADGQPLLRYAERDADRMEGVLRDLGGFDRVERLRDPRPQAIRAALDRVEQAAAADPALQLVFYYSGHADEGGLLIGSERFAFDELRSRLERSRAAVRVALVDACYAGTMVQAKGGKPAPGYALDVAAPTLVRGAAIIAAGTASELAQESGDIEGAYFTHHLLSALRGAGDRDGDGVVTLAETYQYAYSHTLAATLPSVFGPQHPSYDVRLAGTGELPLTRLGRGRQALTFPPASGRTYLVSTSGDDIVAEVAAQPQGRVRLVLPAGRYRIAARQDGRAWLAEVALRAEGGDVAVETSGFREVPPELAFAKGGRPPLRDELAVDLAITGLGPGAINGTLEVGAGYFRRTPWLTIGPHLSFGEHDGEISGLPYTLRRWTPSLFALRRIALGASEIALGLSAGMAFIQERADVDPPRSEWAPTASALLGIDLPITRSVAVRVLWSAGGAVLRVNEQLRLTPEIGASLGPVLRR